MTFTETYRPTTWDEVIAQPRAVKLLQNFESRGRLGGRAYSLAGKSGTGKTTIALIIASKLADPINVYECDAQEITPATIRGWKEDQHYCPMGALPGRVYILNESHGLRKDAVKSLLVFLEELREWTTVIFTTTIDGQMEFDDKNIDADPLMSRCTIVPMAGTELAKPFAIRAMEIAQIEDLGGRSMPYVLNLVNKHKSNMRAVLQAVESGELICSK